MSRYRSPEQRFWSRVFKREDGCWIFNNNALAYGQMTVNHATVLAHRFSYELHNGKIERGHFICHKCDVRGCVNPEHLYEGTHEDNKRDMVDRGSIKKAARRKKDQRALHADHAEMLRQEYASGNFTQTQLAQRYRITQSTVSEIVRGYPRRTNKTGGKRRSGFFRRKMDPKVYQEIKDAYATGSVTQIELAKRYNCTQTHISRIVNNEILKE